MNGIFFLWLLKTRMVELCYTSANICERSIKLSTYNGWRKKTWQITCRTAVENERQCTENHAQRRYDGWSHGNGHRRCWNKRWVCSWKIFVSFLTLSSHLSITTLLYRTILSFIITCHSPSPSCNFKAEAGPEVVNWTKDLFFFDGHVYDTKHHIIRICSSLSFFLFPFIPT